MSPKLLYNILISMTATVYLCPLDNGKSGGESVHESLGLMSLLHLDQTNGWFDVPGFIGLVLIRINLSILHGKSLLRQRCRIADPHVNCGVGRIGRMIKKKSVR